MVKITEVTIEYPSLMVSSDRGFGVILTPPKRDYVVIHWFNDEAHFNRAQASAQRMQKQGYLVTPLQYSKTQEAYPTFETAIRMVKEGDKGRYWTKKLAEQAWGTQ